MVVVSAFKDGSDALRANPVLLVAGLLVGIGSQLQYVGRLIDSPILSTGVSLAWLRFSSTSAERTHQRQYRYSA